MHVGLYNCGLFSVGINLSSVEGGGVLNEGGGVYVYVWVFVNIEYHCGVNQPHKNLCYTSGRL